MLFLLRINLPKASLKTSLKAFLVIAKYNILSCSTSSKILRYTIYCPTAFSKSLTWEVPRKLFISTAIFLFPFSAEISFSAPQSTNKSFPPHSTTRGAFVISQLSLIKAFFTASW